MMLVSSRSVHVWMTSSADGRRVLGTFLGSEQEDDVMLGMHADTGEREAGRLGAEW